MMPVATSFVEVLSPLYQSHDTANHSLGDAQTQILYRDLPGYFESIETYLQTRSIGPDDCVAFECQNTTAALIVLLALLYRGQHVLVLPPQGNTLKEPGFKPDIPAFCQLHMTVSPVSPSDELNRDLITRLLNCYWQENFDTMALNRLDLSRRRLFLRTSGSMGNAKIVVFSHTKLLGNASNCVQRFGLDSDSRVSLAVPIFHQYGFSAGLIPALLAGASIDIQADTNLLRFLDHERRFDPDVVYLNPTLCAILLKGRRQNKRFAQTISAGDALQASHYHEYRERFGPFTNLYGSTEMGAVATACAQSSEDKPTDLRPMPGVQIEIDPDNNSLYCTHPYGFDGYVNSQGQTITIQTSPYKTGDAAKPLSNGYFEFIGRQSNSVNRAGFLVQFSDVEKALLKTGKVEQALVLSSQEKTVRGQRLYGFCVVNTRLPQFREITDQTIRQACAEYLPRYALPDDIILVKTFPLLPNGKVDRHALKQRIITENKEPNS